MLTAFGIYAAIVIGLMFVILCFEPFSPDIVCFSALLFLWCAGEIAGDFKSKDALGGFR